MYNCPITITGFEFNKHFSGERFYKILRSDFTHHGFTYKYGMNTDTKQFNPCWIGEPEGLYFAYSSQICQFLNYGSKIAYVTIDNEVGTTFVNVC